MDRLYFDNAATSFPKPEAVYQAVDDYQRLLGAAVGRGATRTGAAVQKIVDRCRSRAAQLLGVEQTSHVLFTSNATDSLNLALHGLLRPGDRVITTPWEHNSVLRPLRTLADHSVQTEFVRATPEGTIDLSHLDELLLQPTRLVVLTHASNVTGTIQPVSEVVAAAQRAGARVLLDASQTAGHVPLSARNLGVDLLACPGHKGLLGPLGTGLLLLRRDIECELMPIRQGGTGTSSELEQQPAELPARYESGNHNAPGIAGLDAAIGWLLERGVETVRQHELEITTALLSGLRELSAITVHGSASAEARVGVVSLSIRGLEPQTIAMLLDEHFSIETRAGLHCAPRSHRTLGTVEQGGTLRLSPGVFTNHDDVDRVLEALAQLCGAL
ncbi:MAG: aminotransferase class V-fold PLP-dependent enzyme [Planctomycetaceae bacterium]|nr:aminotransferase class V-fold PLP-dependent enzyme [Planctomycetaceae bacterium]